MSTAVIVIIVFFCLLAVGTFAFFALTAKKYLAFELDKKQKAAQKKANDAKKKKEKENDNSDAANYRTIAEGPEKKSYVDFESAPVVAPAENAEEPVAEEVAPAEGEEITEEIEEVPAEEVAEPEVEQSAEVVEEVAENETADETVEETVEVQEEPVVEEVAPVEDSEPVEEVAADDDSADDNDDDDNDDDDADEEIVLSGEENAFAKIRVKKSFVARLTLAPETTKQYYDQIKKAVLSYKKVSSRISWAYDSINFGRTKLATLNVKGKTLYLYLALDASKYEGSKFAVDAVPTKKYAQTPCLYKIKNDRRAKYALELICDLADAFALQSGKECSDDFIPESLTVEQLIEKGLIKLND